MFLKRLLLALLLAVPVVAVEGGCASGARARRYGVSPEPKAVEAVYTVSMMDSAMFQGLHREWNRTIELSNRLGLEQTLARHVAAHELGHALGVEHVEAPAIMASSHGFNEALISTLTKQEILEATPSRGRVIPVVADASVPPLVYEALGWSCALWNRALGVEVLRLVPR